MALVAAAVARRASALIRPGAAAAVIRRMSSSRDSVYIRKLQAEAASLRAEAASYRDRADALRASSHDGELIRVIESAVQSNQRSLVEEIPSDFPFEISKKDGLTDITLTRSFKGEQIEVLVSMPTRDQDDGYTSYSDENQEDEGENGPKELTVPLTVTVSKADGSSLEFSCTGYPDKIDIDDLSMRPSPSRVEEDELAVTSDEDEEIDEVVEFSELDKDLQQSLHEYLELRGINPVTTKILHEYMASKDRRRHLLWLAKLSDFVKKD